TILEETVKKAPTSIPAREALVRAYIGAKDLAQARTAVEDLKLAAPQAASGPYLAGIIAQGENRPADPGKNYERALEIQPNAMDVLAALTRLDVARGHAAQAQKRVTDIIAAQPQNAVARNLLGELQIGAKAWPAAIGTLTEATKLVPQWWLPYRNLA